MNDYNIERRAIHKGLEYIVVAYSGGWRCGYVKIPATRRMYGKGYTQSIVVDRQYESLEYLLDVHGGLTFAGRSTRFGRGWWLGFDCAHSGDGKDFDIMSDDSSERCPWNMGTIVPSSTQSWVSLQIPSNIGNVIG